jgi:ATP-dependent DNA helicase PIF1
MFKLKFREYLSVDSTEDASNSFPEEFLNSLSLSGLPQHSLTLKVGAPVMLLRNINPQDGLSNGTRMTIKRLLNNVIECKVSSGRSAGKVVFIHRVSLISSNKEIPFQLRRHQFPIRVCYAMTINKSQGQTLDTVCDSINVGGGIFA